jgi:hypothetical protein
MAGSTRCWRVLGLKSQGFKGKTRHTHAALVEAAIGVRPSPSAERAEASRLAAAGLEPTAVRAATIDALAAARRGEGRWPLRLKDLALC